MERSEMNRKVGVETFLKEDVDFITFIECV